MYVCVLGTHQQKRILSITDPVLTGTEYNILLVHLSISPQPRKENILDFWSASVVNIISKRKQSCANHSKKIPLKC